MVGGFIKVRQSNIECNLVQTFIISIQIYFHTLMYIQKSRAYRAMLGLGLGKYNRYCLLISMLTFSLSGPITLKV